MITFKTSKDFSIELLEKAPSPLLTLSAKEDYLTKRSFIALLTVYVQVGA